MQPVTIELPSTVSDPTKLGSPLLAAWAGTARNPEGRSEISLAGTGAARDGLAALLGSTASCIVASGGAMPTHPFGN